MVTGRYQHLIKPLNVAAAPKTAQGQSSANRFKNTGNADSIYWLNGRDHLEGLKLNFSWGLHRQPGL
jgi:hypothetical protein